MIRLIPMTAEAREAIAGEVLDISVFPFRLGRESRTKGEFVPQHIMDRRLGIEPPNNDFYLIDKGKMLNISREHFQIEKVPGGFAMFDRMSACGTIIRGEDGDHQCKAKRCLLYHCDIIVVGVATSPFQFRFEILDESE